MQQVLPSLAFACTSPVTSTSTGKGAVKALASQRNSKMIQAWKSAQLPLVLVDHGPLQIASNQIATQLGSGVAPSTVTTVELFNFFVESTRGLNVNLTVC